MISIHQRVFFSALITLCLFLGISAWVLEGFFSKQAETNIQEMLQNYVYSLLATAKEDQQGRMRLPEVLPDPKLNQPDSGTRAYIRGKTEQYEWFSASTLNSSFKPLSSNNPVMQINSGQKFYSITNTNFSRLVYAISWEDYQAVEQHYIILVEIDRQPMDQQIISFRYQLALWLGGSAIILLIALLGVLNWSLQPLRQGVAEIKQIQQGHKNKLSNNYPKELILLTTNINQLIELSINRMKRYRNSLGDLTHSLKTPLAIIQGAYDSNDKQQLRSAVSEQLGQINNLVQYQLQRASIAGENSAFSSIEITALLNKIINSLNKVYIDKNINMNKKMKLEVQYKGDQGDMMELFGNLLLWYWSGNSP